MDKASQLIKGDCLEIMPTLPSHSIDMILCDLPYGTSQNKWDEIIPLGPLWAEYTRLIKPNGAIVLTAAQPFSSMLVLSNPKMFKYEWIWEKTIASGQLNVNIQPLRKHEAVLVFYSWQPVYNQQFTKGKPYSISRKVTFEGPGYNKQSDSAKINSGFRHPTSVLRVSNPRTKGGHPTQKPVSLFTYLVLTYTNEGDTVLDNCIGSGTTAIACINTNRYYVGIEQSDTYYEMARHRIKEHKNHG